jgi:hypothetical protein
MLGSVIYYIGVPFKAGLTVFLNLSKSVKKVKPSVTNKTIFISCWDRTMCCIKQTRLRFRVVDITYILFDIQIQKFNRTLFNIGPIKDIKLI